MSKKLLDIKNLSVQYKTDDAIYNAVNGIDLELNKGETIGIVGETGAGKTTTALSIMRLLPKGVGEITSGSILIGDYKILNLTEADMKLLRGSKVSMIFQDPMTSLNPVLTIEDQIGEVLILHNDNPKREISNRVDEILELVGIPPSRKIEYPHQFSGGMKQRVVIAMALACNPELLIADEPTTALDVTIQAQVLEMMNSLKEKFNTSMILITHDLGIVAQICDKVAVMYAGEIIEVGSVVDIYEAERHHPYTIGLFGSIPDITSKAKRLKPINGLMPDSSNLPLGCKFHNRCPKCMDICKTTNPLEKIISTSHKIKCHLFS